jgi:type IV secretory pathway component VirB8
MKTVIEQNDKNADLALYEHFAGPTVTNIRMLIVCTALAIVSIILAALLAYTWQSVRHQRVVILQESSDGALDRVQYLDAGDHKPGEKELEYFAMLYVTETYSRVRSTIAEGFTNHLAFLPDDRRRAERVRAIQTKWIENFIQNFDPEIRVEITKVRFAGGGQNRIAVDFDKHFAVNGRPDPTHDEKWTVDLAYTVAPEELVSSDLTPVNPLGMIILEARESKGF